MILKWLLRPLAWLLLAVGVAWAFGALWFDFPVQSLRQVVALFFLVAVLAVLIRVRKPRWCRALIIAAAAAVVAALWLCLQPRADRDWLPDVSRVAWADVGDDEITIHNVRNCDYRSTTDYTVRWETRVVRLSQLTGADISLTNWGSPLMSHPIVSFTFADAPPLAFSIETRKEKGEGYSAIRQCR